MPKYRDPETGFEAEAVNPEAFGRLLDARLGPHSTAEPPPMTIRVGGSREPEGPPIPSPRDYARAEGSEAGPLTAAGTGFATGLTRGWGDEIAALAAASGLPPITHGGVVAPAVGGARMMMGDEGASGAYERQLEQTRGFEEGARKAHPYAGFAGEVAGGMMGPVQAPGVLPGLARGALEGAISGVGAGETAEGRTIGGGLGAAGGGAIGAALPALWNVGASAFRGAQGLLGLGAREGERQAAAAVQADIAAQDPLMRDYLANAARSSGQAGEQVIGDTGEAIRQLALTSGNLDPTALDQMRGVAQERFQREQGGFRDFWGQRNSLETADALREAARTANAPRYTAAYARGEQGVWTPELQTLTTSDSVQRAIRDAVNIGRDEAARRGQRVPRNPFVEREGVMVLPEGARPTLEFWDHVQRALREQAEAQPRGGAAATRVEGLRRQLNQQLDTAIPEFGAARRGAAEAFGEEDALDAGRTFLDRPTKNMAEEKRALGRMNQPERDLFRMGLEESVLEKVMGRPFNRPIHTAINSPELQDRLRMGLGPRRAQEFENYMRIAGTMDRLRTVFGNSTTVRQRELVELFKRGAIPGGATAAAGGYTIDSVPTTTAGALALVSGAIMTGNQAMTQAAARRVAQLIVSQDPADMQMLLTTAVRNPAVGRAIRDGFTSLENALIGTLGREIGEDR